MADGDVTTTTAPALVVRFVEVDGGYEIQLENNGNLPDEEIGTLLEVAQEKISAAQPRSAGMW